MLLAQEENRIEILEKKKKLAMIQYQEKLKKIEREHQTQEILKDMIEVSNVDETIKSKKKFGGVNESEIERKVERLKI